MREGLVMGLKEKGCKVEKMPINVPSFSNVVLGKWYRENADKTVKLLLNIGHNDVFAADRV